MRVAVIDDEREERERMQSFLERFAEEFSRKIEVSQFTCGDELLREYSYDFDILIFDIDMPGTSGLDTAREIRKKDENVVILFVTNMAQYAINGYEVEAVDYIIKPVGYYDFSMKFQKAVSKAAQRRDRTFALETVDGTRKVRVSDIWYVEVLSHYLMYHTKEGCFKVRGSMKVHEAELAPYDLCRIHKSYLVNMAYVEEIRTGEAEVGGDVLPVGRSYKEKFMQEYLRYIRG